MVKINVPKAFEKSILDGETRRKLDQFIDYVNQNFDQLNRAFLNQITFTDNLFGRTLEVNAMNATATSIDIGGATPSGVIVLKSDTAIKSFSFTALNTGVSQVTFNFDEPITVKSRIVTFSSPFATYECEGLASVDVGDVVDISGFGNKSNNGQFVVLRRSENLLTVYNSAAAAEAKSSFTGTREVSKSVKLFVLS